jgi:hypothetical protein
MDDQRTDREGGALKRHFHFSLRNLLIAMAWLSPWAAVLAILHSILRDNPMPPGNWPWMLNRIFLLCAFLFFWLPCVAAGALLGRTKRGMVFGLGFVLVVAVPLFTFTAIQVHNSLQTGQRIGPGPFYSPPQ